MPNPGFSCLAMSTPLPHSPPSFFCHTYKGARGAPPPFPSHYRCFLQLCWRTSMWLRKERQKKQNLKGEGGLLVAGLHHFENRTVRGDTLCSHSRIPPFNRIKGSILKSQLKRETLCVEKRAQYHQKIGGGGSFHLEGKVESNFHLKVP